MQKTLSNGDDDRIGFFDFFTIEKREFLQHVFLYVAPQSAINRISTSTPRSTLHYHSIQTTLLCQQYISISQAYYFIAIYYQSDHSILLLYKKSHFTQHHFHVGFTQHRLHSSVAPPATILPVSSQLDLRFNSTELFKIIARAVLLSQLNCIFQAINHNACLAQLFLKIPLLKIHTF